MILYENIILFWCKVCFFYYFNILVSASIGIFEMLHLFYFYWKWFLKYTVIMIHESFWNVFSAHLYDEITFHTSHICYFSGLYGRYWCASSDYLKLRRILHKNHVCNFFLLYGYGSSLYAYLDYLIGWNIFHNNCIWNFFAFHGLSWYDSSGLLI